MIWGIIVFLVITVPVGVVATIRRYKKKNKDN